MAAKVFQRGGLLIIGDGDDIDDIQASEEWIAADISDCMEVQDA